MGFGNPRNAHVCSSKKILRPSGVDGNHGPAHVATSGAGKSAHWTVAVVGCTRDICLCRCDIVAFRLVFRGGSVVAPIRVATMPLNTAIYRHTAQLTRAHAFATTHSYLLGAFYLFVQHTAQDALSQACAPCANMRSLQLFSLTTSCGPSMPDGSGASRAFCRRTCPRHW